MSPENYTCHHNPGSDLSRQALGWLVRLNRQAVSLAEANALRRWCARSAAHAQAWAEATRLWCLLLPAARAFVPRAGCPLHTGVREPQYRWRSGLLRKPGEVPLKVFVQRNPMYPAGRGNAPKHRHPIKGLRGRPQSHCPIRSFK